MYERFTDRARKTMQLANKEAHRSNHATVNTLHVLIAILQEGAGVGAAVLRHHDIQLGQLRAVALQLQPPGSEMSTEGKLPLSAEVQAMLKTAVAVSKQLDDGFVGTEHLLIALAEMHDEPCTKALAVLDAELKNFSRETLQLLGKPVGDLAAVELETYLRTDSRVFCRLKFDGEEVGSLSLDHDRYEVFAEMLTLGAARLSSFVTFAETPRNTLAEGPNSET